jgi:hypothetical protein
MDNQKCIDLLNVTASELTPELQLKFMNSNNHPTVVLSHIDLTNYVPFNVSEFDGLKPAECVELFARRVRTSLEQVKENVSKGIRKVKKYEKPNFIVRVYRRIVRVWLRRILHQIL